MADRSLGCNFDGRPSSYVGASYICGIENEASGEPGAQTIIFPERPPINYHPTANDFDTLPGFDIDAGKQWQYPNCVELRKYQFVISERCLYQNSFVCIPTGMGKTFIAAVVLHNFLRWYPSGLVVFMAPTRPLVSQQMSACRSFTGLTTPSDRDKDDGILAVELTGATPPHQRAAFWTGSHRAFFLTPQVIANDLSSGICPASSIRCIVIDEAHKATGNHAYCQVIRAITAPPYNHRQFRVVALSATPASDLVGAQMVISNLLISHVEIRTEDSKDIREFRHERSIKTIVVKLDSQLNDFKRRLCDLARPPLQRLSDLQALWHRGPINAENFAPFTLVKAREKFTQNYRNSPHAGAVHQDFKIAICLTRAIQMLAQYGLKSVYLFMLHNLKGDFASLFDAHAIVSDIGVALGVSGSASMLSQIPFVSGHPKLLKLRELLIEHFTDASKNNPSQRSTRAIVFTQFRDSVSEIMHMLKVHSPLLRPAVFVGQSSGFQNSEDSPAVRAQRPSRKKNTQRDQLRVVEEFREGKINILISTCIGEEGLDIGQVDLIVCFDAHKSPGRLVQRLGRTGRKRTGHVVVLLTEGHEQANFAQSMARLTTMHRAFIQSKSLPQLTFYPHNPRMVPLGVDPVAVTWKPDIFIPQKTVSLTPSRKNSLKSDIMDNWKAYNLGSSSRCLSRCENAPIISLGELEDDKRDLFTVRYSSRRHLFATREDFQSDSTGPSATTWHLMSTLRLIELHRKGRTHAMFHAAGMRNVDMSRPLSDLVPSGMSQLTQTVDPIEAHPPSSIWIKQSVNRRLQPSSSTQLPSVRFFEGLVSKKLMVDPCICSTDTIQFPEELPPFPKFTVGNLKRALTSMVSAAFLCSKPDCQSGVAPDPCASNQTSILFDDSFGIPAPMKKSNLCIDSSGNLRGNSIDMPNDICKSNENLNHNAGHQDIVFNSKLLFDDKLDDFLRTT